MEKNKVSYKPRLFNALQSALDPLFLKIEKIELSINSFKVRPQYYRNEDLKKMFGLSNNTIIKYRQTGILPYTKLGDIFLYDSGKIDKILRSNES